MQKFNKLLCASLATLTCLVTFTGCSNNQKGTNVVACSPVEKSQKGIWYEFQLAEDNKTVNNFIYHASLDEQFFRENVTFENGEKIKDKNDLQQAWNFYAASFSELMDNTLPYYGDESWFYFDTDGSEDNYTLNISFGFDLTDKSLNFEDDGIRMTIDSILGSTEDFFYNKDEKCYQVVPETLEKTFSQNDGYDFKCTNKVIKDSDDLEFTKLTKKIANLRNPESK